MLIDNAVAAFRAEQGPKLHLDRSLIKAGNWIIKDDEGKRITAGSGHSRADCEQMKDDAILAAKITAAIREMISVRVLTIALINCGAPPDKAHDLACRLLPAMVDLMAQEDTTAAVNLHVVKDDG